MHCKTDSRAQLSKISSIQFTWSSQTLAPSIDRRKAPYFGMHLNVGSGGVVVAVVVVVGEVVALDVIVVLVVAVVVAVVVVVGVVVVVNVVVAVLVGVVTSQSRNPPFCHSLAMPFNDSTTSKHFSLA